MWKGASGHLKRPRWLLRRGRVWCSLELIAEVHFEVHCVLNFGSLGVVGVVPWIAFLIQRSNHLVSYAHMNVLAQVRALPARR
jgi:hypothetical protein